MKDELVERLRNRQGFNIGGACEDAADRIEELEAEREWFIENLEDVWEVPREEIEGGYRHYYAAQAKRGPKP